MATSHLLSSTVVSIDLKIAYRVARKYDPFRAVLLHQALFSPIEQLIHGKLFNPFSCLQGAPVYPLFLIQQGNVGAEICQWCESQASRLAAFMAMLAGYFAVLLAAVSTTKGMPLTQTSSHRRLICETLEELLLLAADVPQLAPSSLSWCLLPCS